jgi:hypothetical protein
MMTPAERLRQRGLLEVARGVADKHRLPLGTLLGRGRQASVAAARNELYWRLRNLPELQLSTTEIGRLLGRDHTTVLSGLAAHRATLTEREAQAMAVEGALQRAMAVRQQAIDVLAADLRRIEEALPLLGLASLDELRAADGGGSDLPRCAK